MSEDFIKTAELVKALVIDQQTQLKLYGLYKQATQGDVMISPPTNDLIALAKYNSWQVHKGKSSTEAENEYIQIVKSFNTGWGISVSRPQFEEIEEKPLSSDEENIRKFCEFVKEGVIDEELLKVVGVNCQDRQGLTPLHHAVDEGRIETVIRLFELGANPNIQDSEGMTPLHYAAELDNEELLQILISLPGVDTSIKDHEGNSIYQISFKLSQNRTE